MDRGKPGNAEFSIFYKLLDHKDLLLYFTTQHLEPRELFILYQICRPFHIIVNDSLTSYMLSAARRWARLTATRPAPETGRKFKQEIPGLAGNQSVNLHAFRSRHTVSKRVLLANGTEPTPSGTYSPHDITTLLPYRCYSHFCVADPGRRDFSSEVNKVKKKPLSWLTLDPSEVEGAAEGNSPDDASSSTTLVIRDVPTFRYLGFLLHRARMIQLIIHHLAQRGHRLPTEETPAVLAKISLTLDIPTNSRRMALFRNRKYWTNRDLYFANFFFIKLDMCFTDPVDGAGETGLRKLLLSQPGLETLEATLARTKYTTFFEIMKLWVRTFHRPAREHQHFDIFGIPAKEVGKTCLEGWGKPVWEYDPVYACMLRRVVQDRSMAMRHAQGRPISSNPAHPGTVIAQWLPILTDTTQRRLLRPEQLIQGESARRKFPIHHHYARMMTWGYLDPHTGLDLPDPAEESNPNDEEAEAEAEEPDSETDQDTAQLLLQMETT